MAPTTASTFVIETFWSRPAAERPARARDRARMKIPERTLMRMSER